MCLRNCASASGSRERSSRRKYSDTNRSPPVKPSGLSELAAPARIDSAARYKPAGHPSVRSVNSATSPASSSTPASASSIPASCSSSRRSPTPISSTEPCARQRPRGRAGSSLLATAIWEPAGTYRESSASTSRQAGLATACRSSSASTSGRSRAASAPPTRGTRVDQVDPPGPDNASKTSGETGSSRCIAAAMYRRNTTASSSRPSSATQANGRGSASAQRASRVVLPYPAGATTVARGVFAVHSREMTSAFATVPGRGSGAASLASARSKGTSATATEEPC